MLVRLNQTLFFSGRRRKKLPPEKQLAEIVRQDIQAITVKKWVKKGEKRKRHHQLIGPSGGVFSGTFLRELEQPFELHGRQYTYEAVEVKEERNTVLAWAKRLYRVTLTSIALPQVSFAVNTNNQANGEAKVSYQYLWPRLQITLPSRTIKVESIKNKPEDKELEFDCDIVPQFPDNLIPQFPDTRALGYHLSLASPQAPVGKRKPVIALLRWPHSKLSREGVFYPDYHRLDPKVIEVIIKKPRNFISGLLPETLFTLPIDSKGLRPLRHSLLKLINMILPRFTDPRHIKDLRDLRTELKHAN